MFKETSGKEVTPCKELIRVVFQLVPVSKGLRGRCRKALGCLFPGSRDISGKKPGKKRSMLYFCAPSALKQVQRRAAKLVVDLENEG